MVLLLRLLLEVQHQVEGRDEVVRILLLRSKKRLPKYEVYPKVSVMSKGIVLQQMEVFHHHQVHQMGQAIIKLLKYLLYQEPK